MATPFKVKALYEYVSPHDDDLGFPAGQIITVTEVEDADWYYGEYLDPSGSKKEGIFPMNFVEKMEPPTPPRPTRSTRHRKEADSVPPLPVPDVEEEPGPGQIDDEAEPEISTPVASPPEPNIPVPKDALPTVSRAAPKAAPAVERAPPPPSPTGPGIQTAQSQTKAKPAAPAAPAANPEIGSFRDRIAAFNKPAAPPIAPFKPGGLSSPGGSSFIKKPFVAPPPSKNAYVPTSSEQNVRSLHRKEEPADNGPSEGAPIIEKSQAISSAPDADADDEPQQKPTSLKERIALLQKQQQEQAARHAEAAQRKEKPKRPSKKRIDSFEQGQAVDEASDGEAPERTNTADTVGRKSIDAGLEEDSHARTTHRGKASTGGTRPRTSGSRPRDVQSDANDADQSAAGETEDGADSTELDESDHKAKTRAPVLPTRSASTRTEESQEPKEDTDDEDEEEDVDEDGEEADVDPEVRRRMELRERMAKMSGGMGMPGMFGPPAGIVPSGGPPKKKRSGRSQERKASGEAEGVSAATSQAPPVPLLGFSHRPRVQSPEGESRLVSSGKDEDEVETPIAGSDFHSTEAKPQSISQAPIASPRQERPVPNLPPATARGQPPQPPNDRPVPAPPTHPRPVLASPSLPMSPSAGSESDDEMSLQSRQQSFRAPAPQDSQPMQLPPVAPSVPARPEASSPQTPLASTPAQSGIAINPQSPTLSQPGSTNKRSSRGPPIPVGNPVVSGNSQGRPPPPPPPSVAPAQSLSRSSTGDTKPRQPAIHAAQEESDEEVTEYEGDYDTDIASGSTHKDALKRTKDSGDGDDNTSDDTSARSPPGSAPRLPPPIPQVSAPRAVPPPPPVQPPPPTRQSSDMPRSRPPPVPPAKRTQEEDGNDEEYDPFRYTGPIAGSQIGLPAVTPAAEEQSDMYSMSPRVNHPPDFSPAGYSAQDRPAPLPSSQQSPLGPQQGSRPQPRASLDVPRGYPGPSRRSNEQGRPSGEFGFIAADVDLGQNSQWWKSPNTPPPVFQNRRDVVFHLNESSTDIRGAISKTVYVLFQDYSQTIITAVFDPNSETDVSLQQRHEPPPQRLRQDQLEEAHSRFGQRISESVVAMQNSVVGDGSPQALISELLGPLPDALVPVGFRSYGALVYANLANASVQQHDEIRAGDIITLRNAKFQGHRGTMHQKYTTEVGKPDHVGVVVDWDGTKKKVRVWEQGRENKKVKMDGFKLGDLKSGEVKIWRVMARGWVGWN